MRILFILTLFISSLSSAQWAVGLFAEPSYQISSLRPFDGPDHDSLDAMWNNDVGYAVGLNIKYNIDRVNAIQFKPGYYQYGFMLLRENLGFLDQIHPTMDTLFDESQGSSKNAYMHHQFRYAGFQIDYLRNISPKTKSLGFDIHWGVGLGYYYLLNQHLKVRTEGFAMDEKFVHHIDEELYFEPATHLFSLAVMGQAVYHPTPNWDVFGQLAFRTALNNLTVGDAQAFNLSPNISVGFRRVL